MANELSDVERLSVLEDAHTLLCARRRNLHKTIDSLELAASEFPEASASLESYKVNERRISSERQQLYVEIGDLIRAIELANKDRSSQPAAMGATPTGTGNPSSDAVLADYGELVGKGFCIPTWASGHYELNADEEAWLDALKKQAAIDEIRITHTWEARGERWNLIATIAPPRHDRKYRRPKTALGPALEGAVRARLGTAIDESPTTRRRRTRSLLITGHCDPVTGA